MPAARAKFGAKFRAKFGAKFAAIVVTISLAGAVHPLLARKKDKGTMPAGADDQRRAVHALNRLTFGPRPGDVQHVMAMGVDQWIDLQLHPEKVADNALNARLEPLRTLRMNTKEIAEDFPDGQEITQVINGKRSMPSDPALRMIYEVQIARQQEKKERKQDAGKDAGGKNGASMEAAAKTSAAATDGAVAADNSAASQGMNNTSEGTGTSMATPDAKLTPAEEQARRREDKLYADLDAQEKSQRRVKEQINELPGVPADQRFKKVLSLSPEGQLAVADSLRGGKNQEIFAGLAPKQKEMLQALNYPPGVVTGELSQAKLLRAIYSDRQLEEVMTDFWFNHFNVFADKGVDRLLLTSYERDVIRPRALGKFEDLLVATAKSPAMLFYLDNWLSVGPDSPQALGIPQHPGPYGRPYRPRPNQNKRSGLNENYGRELLELHTLSVNGGYSQRDVTEVAKVFTGWTIDKPFQGGEFKFDPRTHEPGPKFVLGKKIKFKGEGEGLEILHRLATNPQTARFISLKLAQRFVSDDPPPALVDAMAKTFLKKKGDIREVLSTLFHSPEFWDDGAYRAKVKTPLEFVASAVRATGAEVDDAMPLVRQLNNMGMPLYGAQPPTGYSMKAETWVSSSALLNRMNFALALASGKTKNVKVDLAPLAAGTAGSLEDSSTALTTLEVTLLGGDVSKQTHDSIVAQITSGQNAAPKPDNKSGQRKPAEQPRSTDVATIAGLLLGSPEFQRR
jgi:uncharacterized protein (DUF1800 family)